MRHTAQTKVKFGPRMLSQNHPDSINKAIVASHLHSSGLSATLAESSRTDSISARSSGFQMLQLNSTDTPGQRTLSDRGPREQIQAVTDTYKYVTADDSYVS